jgi:hypothetical protein
MMGPQDYIDADAMYEARFERDETFDDFDSEVQCEEVYEDEEPWDGDWEGADAEVLASAGMGTDEDYGYSGGGEDW